MSDENQHQDIFELRLEQELKNNLQKAASWARTIAIVTFLSAGLTILDIILTLTGVISIPGKEASLGIQLFSAIISVALAFYLLKFHEKISEGLRHQNQQELNAGIHHLSLYFKYYVIIIVIAIVLALLFAVAIAASVGSM